MKIPRIIEEAAKKNGLGSMKYVGQINGSTVYVETYETDKNGLPTPTGMPCCIVLKDGKTEFVGGLKALDLLGRFY